MQFEWKYDTENIIQRFYTFYSTFSQNKMNEIYIALKSNEYYDECKKSSVKLFQKFNNLNINIVNIIYVIDSLSDNDLYSIIRNFIIHLSKYEILHEDEKIHSMYEKKNREELLDILNTIIGENELRLFLFVHELYSAI